MGRQLCRFTCDLPSTPVQTDNVPKAIPANVVATLTHGLDQLVLVFSRQGGFHVVNDFKDVVFDVLPAVDILGRRRHCERYYEG